MDEPSEKAKQAEALLRSDTFSVDEARKKLTGLTQDELTWLSRSFMDFIHSLFFYHDELDSSMHPENDAFIESVAADMEKRLLALIDAGLDPNHMYDEENPIWFFQYITDEHNLNARLLRILLEHGGNPNVNHADDAWDDSNIFEYVDQKIIHDPEKREQMIPYLMMLAGFGGKTRDGDNFFTMTGNHKIEEFKLIEKLCWTVESSEYEKEKNLFVICVSIHIFNRETGEEIAHYD
ncbi:MAG: hypothetical protein IJI53_01315 [Clostridia bacterium]|nr:hypothetical protein [Clostridia bacterium]